MICIKMSFTYNILYNIKFVTYTTVERRHTAIMHMAQALQRVLHGFWAKEELTEDF